MNTRTPGRLIVSLLTVIFSIHGSFAQAADPDTLKFDFGGAQKIEAGYHAVTPVTLYSADAGFGWVNPPALIARDVGKPDALRRDFIQGTRPATFRVTGLTAGMYQLTLLCGDLTAGNHSTRVQVKGSNAELPVVTPAANELVTMRTTVRATDSIEITFDAPRVNWIVNALELAKVDQEQSPEVTRRSLASTPDDNQSHTLVFDTQAPGQKLPLTSWGLDTAWAEKDHITRGELYMGNDHVNVIRVSFPVNVAIVNGQLPESKKEHFETRRELAKLVGDRPWTMLPDTEGGVNPWYKNGREVNPERWAQLIAASQKLYGKKLETIEPFNEADWGWGQGSIQNLNDILALLQKHPDFTDVQFSGPSTLSCDAADAWYQPIKEHLARGTTHSLGGNFNNYINFYVNVSANGKIADQPEAHNLVEVISGAEYGLQRAIWWGTAERSRGEFVKAVHGERLAYAEDRARWSAAGVYRTPDQKIQAFLGCSERSGQLTRYRFVSRDRPVFFNGDGPRRDIELPIRRDTESLINITWGQDVAPVVEGKYIIVNRQSGKILGVTTEGQVQMMNAGQMDQQQWEVSPIFMRWGDHSYVTLRSSQTGQVLSIPEKSFDDGARLTQLAAGDVPSGHWYLDYAGQNNFVIRNRWSTQCLSPGDAKGDGPCQTAHAEAAQQWRLIPVGSVPIDFDAPQAPKSLTAKPRPLAVALDWEASPESDLAGYTVLRSTKAGGPYEIIARGLKDHAYVDRDARDGKKYFYVVQASDRSLNTSAFSPETSASCTGGNAVVARYLFKDQFADDSGNGNHAVAYGQPRFSFGPAGRGAVDLDGQNDYLRLPVGSVDSDELTIAAWIYPQNTGEQWQRVFDLGNDESQYFFLTTCSSENTLRLAARNGGAEITLDSKGLPENRWSHVAITLSGKTARMYVDGKLVSSKEGRSIKPADFKPIFNYIGKSQFAPDPLFKGRISGLQINNHALSSDEIAKMASRR